MFEKMASDRVIRGGEVPMDLLVMPRYLKIISAQMEWSVMVRWIFGRARLF